MVAITTSPGAWRRLTSRFTMHESTRAASFLLASGVLAILTVSFSTRVLARLLRSGSEPQALESVA